MYATWIKNGIAKPGKSAIGLAQAITKALKLKKPMHRITIYKMISGKRSVYSEELAPIAAYIEEPIPNMPSAMADLISIPIAAEIGAGVWTERVDTGPLGAIVAPKDQTFPNSKAIAYAIKGDSMVNVGILEGDVVICIPPQDDEIEDGRQVVIERERSGLVELSARIVKKYKDRVEYVVASPNESRYKPCVVPNKGSSKNETVKVVAIIRRVTRNIP